MGALEEGRFVEEQLTLELADCGSDSGSGSESEAGKEIEDAVRVLLQGLGEDHHREGITKTPLRVSKALRDGTRGYGQKVREVVEGALFPEAGLENAAGCAGGVGGLVVVRDINLFSYCESCLLPFKVQCHVGYVPSAQRVLGLSKLSRVADIFAKRLQDPQRLADEICLALQSSINPAGVAVSLQCWHIQFPETQKCNGNPRHPSKFDMQGWNRASICSSSGVLGSEDSSFWQDFLSLLTFRGIDMDLGTPIHSWCPMRSLEELPPCNSHSMRNLSNGNACSKSALVNSAMISAVVSILESLGEDPLRKELRATPYRYVHWLMNFKRSVSNGSGYGMIALQKGPGGVVGNGRGKVHSELNLPFCSQCEHHLLPFYGVVHVGYICEEEGEVIDRSHLQSVVHFYGCKLQVQERLTRQIAETVYPVVGRGVMVVVEADHICMISRGIEKVGSNTATIAVMGQFSSDFGAKALLFKNISKSTVSGG